MWIIQPSIDALATEIISVDGMIDSTLPLEKFQEAIEHAEKPDTLKVFSRHDL